VCSDPPTGGAFPTVALRLQVAEAGLTIHSAPRLLGSQSIAARRVTLAAADSETRRESVDDLRRCVDWLAEAGGTMLVVHPGGLSDAEEARHDARAPPVARGAGPTTRAAGVVLCVENMPPGVHPGSRMAELATIVTDLGRPEVGLALDTGNTPTWSTRRPSRRAPPGRSSGRRTSTTTTAGRDVHLPPGHGTIDWPDWIAALDEIDYEGPVHARVYPLHPRQLRLLDTELSRPAGMRLAGIGGKTPSR